MFDLRYKAAGVSINDHQFLVTGGKDRREDCVLASCEYYNVRTKRWHNLSVDLPHPLMGHGIAYTGNMLYVFGGQSGDKRHTSSARSEVFSLRVPDGDLSNVQPGQRWEPLASMPLARCNFALISDDQYVYVIGGTEDPFPESQDVKQQWFTADRYDVQRDSWTSLPHIPPKSDTQHNYYVGRNCGAALIGNKIFVVGGRRGFQDERWTQVFDIDRQSWSSWGRFFPGDHTDHCVLTWNNFLIRIGQGYDCWCADAAHDIESGWQRSRYVLKNDSDGCVAGILTKNNCKFVIVAGSMEFGYFGRTQKMDLERLVGPLLPTRIFENLRQYIGSDLYNKYTCRPQVLFELQRTASERDLLVAEYDQAVALSQRTASERDQAFAARDQGVPCHRESRLNETNINSN